VFPGLPIFLNSRVTKALKQIRKLAHPTGPITGPSGLHNVMIDASCRDALRTKVALGCMLDAEFADNPPYAQTT
jgi:hypothetical protein